MSDPTHDEDVRLVVDAVLRCDVSGYGHRDALDRILTRYDALMEEHEAWKAWRCPNDSIENEQTAWAAHDKVEGLIK